MPQPESKLRRNIIIQWKMRNLTSDNSVSPSGADMVSYCVVRLDFHEVGEEENIFRVPRMARLVSKT